MQAWRQAVWGAAPQDLRLMGYQGHTEKQEPSQLLHLSPERRKALPWQLHYVFFIFAMFSTAYFGYIFWGFVLKTQNFFPIPTLLRRSKTEWLEQSQIPYFLYPDNTSKSPLNFFFEYLMLQFKTVQTRGIRKYG